MRPKAKHAFAGVALGATMVAIVAGLGRRGRATATGTSAGATAPSGPSRQELRGSWLAGKCASGIHQVKVDGATRIHRCSDPDGTVTSRGWIAGSRLLRHEIHQPPKTRWWAWEDRTHGAQLTSGVMDDTATTWERRAEDGTLVERGAVLRSGNEISGFVEERGPSGAWARRKLTDTAPVPPSAVPAP